MFHVNWFRRDKHGKFLWPGYGENLRVLEWIIQRSRGEGAAKETPIGYVPARDALDMTGLELEKGVLDKLLHVDAREWMAEADDIEKFFDSLGPRVPWELRNELEALRNRFAESEEK